MGRPAKTSVVAIFSVTSFLLGLLLISYSFVGSWWSNWIVSAAARAYHREATGLSQLEIDWHFQRAYNHNAELSRLDETSFLWLGHFARLPDDYMDILNVGGVMARLRIPSIRVDLPILHTTSQDVMEGGVGHLEGTAFPTGGYGNHTAMTAHSGAPTHFFSRLYRLEEGDLFYIYVLDRRLVYQVDRITVILPSEIEHLRVEPGRDLVTLITCTPIHVNTHRLLVRGVRVGYGSD